MKTLGVAAEETGAAAFPIYTQHSRSWSKTCQVSNGGFKLLLAEENIYFFHIRCKKLLPTGNALRKHSARQTPKQLQHLPLYARGGRKYTVSGKATEVLNTTHRTVVLPMRLVQFNPTPESCISKEESQGISSRTPEAFLQPASWYRWHSAASGQTVSS